MRILICALLVTAISPATWSNQQGDAVVSVYSGDTPFMVVNSGQAPNGNTGVFKKTATGWSKILSGPVLYGANGSPIFKQLALSRIDNKAYSVVVATGSIYIVTSLSDESKPGTMIQLGTGAGSLIEVGTGQKRFLPPITDPSKISIMASENTDQGQVILVSVKFDQASPLGEAMTIALVLKPTTNGVLELVSRPAVIDYDFHSLEKLGTLLIERNNQTRIVYSKLLIEQLEHSVTQADPSLTARMGVHWDHFLDYVRTEFAHLLGDNVSKQEATESVAYDLLAGRTIANVTFEEPYSFRGGSLDQLYSPLTGQGEVEIGLGGASANVNGFVGMLDGQPLLAATDGVLLAFIDGQLFAAANVGHNVVVTKVKETTDASKIKKFVMHSARTKSGRCFVVYSLEYLDGSSLSSSLHGVTKSFELIQHSPFLISAGENTLKLTDSFINAEELNQRLQFFQNNDQLTFDSATATSANVEAYRMSVDPHAPRVNLSLSVGGKTVFQYTKPSKNIAFEPGLDLAFFRDAPGIANPTGLYANLPETSVPTGLEQSAVRGQLLVQHLQSDENIEELPAARLKLARVSLRNSDIGVYEHGAPRSAFVYAVDPNHLGGARNFVITVASNAHTDKPENFVLATGLVDRNLAFTKLTAVRIVRGRRLHKDKLFIALSGSDALGVSSKTLLFRVDLWEFGSKNSAVPITLPTPLKLQDQAMDETELTERLIFSEEGSLYFVKTPQIAKDSTVFEVLDLVKNETIKPALRTGAQKITFADKSDVADESYGGDYIKQVDDWAVSPHELQKVYPDAVVSSANLKDFDSFQDLKNLLTRLADQTDGTAGHILVVPANLRDLVCQYVIGQYLSDIKWEGKTSGFYAANGKMDLRIFDSKKGHQDQILANLDQMRKKAKSNKKTVLFARMDEISKVGASDSKEGESFRIEAYAAGTVAGGMDGSVKKEQRLPNALYLLAAGGAVSLDQFRKTPPQLVYSILIIATPEEMKALDATAVAETDAGMLKRFAITQIRNPDAATMASSISQIFEGDEVKKLGFEFDASEIKKNAQHTSDESFSVVLEYAISRFESLCDQKKLSTFESFMRFRNALATAILTDRELLRTRKIDKHFVERMLTQVFDIPINLAILPVDDPLRILARKDAPLKLQEAGYAGPFDLKMKVIQSILSQTQAEAGKPIPSSTILFGETGAGKTDMFIKLMKMLGVKLYDFANPLNNMDAGAIIINVGKLGDGAKGTDEGMTAEQAISHLNQFLALPNGFRGFVLIDDAHANTNSNKGKILAWLRGLFESSGGMYTAGGVRRPIRNLSVFMTLNPTADQDQIAKFAKDKANPTKEETLLATLSSNEFKVEPSFIRRWGTTIHMDYMPAGAKGPELINALGAASREQLTTSGRIALVDPSVISQIVRRSEKLDARTFLSASVGSLMRTINETQLKGSIAMVIPSSSSRAEIGGSSFASDPNVSPSDLISRWVTKNTRVITLDGSVEGNLANMRLIIDAFRTPIYEFMLNALLEDPRFSGDEMTQKRLLTPILMAIYDHINERNSVPLSALDISSADFGMKTAGERADFRAILERLSSTDRPFFPIHFESHKGAGQTWDSMLKDAEERQVRSRHDILSETMQSLKTATKSHLGRVLNMADVDTPERPEAWLSHLGSHESPQIKQIGRDVAESLWTFLPAIFDERLIEVRDSRAPMNTYAAARLYLYALDRAVVEMPWVKVNQFILKSLEMVAQDQVLSQKPGVQAFLFSNRYRLVKPTTSDLVNQIIANSPAFMETPQEYRTRLQKAFSSDCELYLTPRASF